MDKVLDPDATMFLPTGQVWHIEFDTGHQRGDQINNRWKVYAPLARQFREVGEYLKNHPEEKGKIKMPPGVLVVTQRRELDGLLNRAAPYAAFMHFAFYKEIMEKPFGEVIRTFGGRLVAFPRLKD